jgi:hypothetical protein
MILTRKRITLVDCTPAYGAWDVTLKTTVKPTWFGALFGVSGYVRSTTWRGVLVWRETASGVRADALLEERLIEIINRHKFLQTVRP